MTSALRPRRIVKAAALLAGVAGSFAAPSTALASGISYVVSANTLVSSCSGHNAEVEQAVDPSNPQYVYEEWMGCSGITFRRSADGGQSFGPLIGVPGSVGSGTNSWDPALAVDPSNGTVYAAFMRAKNSQWYPVVDASFDHGQTFPQVSPLVPPDPKNWGDRDFIAVGPDHTVYVTYDYGPERTSVTFICTTTGSCAFATGDLNVILQKSTDGGKTWSKMVHLPPPPGYQSFPAQGGDSAPMVVEPNGRVDVLFQGYHILNQSTYAMEPACSFFTASRDGGATWSTPVNVGAGCNPSTGADTMSLWEWWIDGDIGIDSAGNLYASWDTQGSTPSTPDIGWLSFSTDQGRRWSALQGPLDQAAAPHIMEVAGGPSGIAYVSWLSSSDPRGYAEYLRTFSATRSWLSAPLQVSTNFGDPSVWPGDTTGISTAAPSNPSRVILSWGGTTPTSGKNSEILAATVIVRFQ